MTTKESTALSGVSSIGTHVSETNVKSSHSSCTVKEILGAHPMNDDEFWGNTNPNELFF